MKNIIITGASRGIGRDTALQLAKEGHRVLAISRNEGALRALEAEAGGQLQALPFDLTSTDCRAVVAAADSWGHVDAVVNNAGYLLNKPFHETTGADWEKIMGVNFYGPARLLQMLRPYLQAAPRAHVVNIGSMGGYQGSSKFPGLLAYSVSKGALAVLTECLAEEWKQEGVAVNCLALGAVQTEMLAAAFPGMQAPVSSEDMGGFLSYFTLHGHQFFNGKVLPVSVSTP
ncbi:SDR family NAD(P)-dependent oxidoreductase [Phaeodactylibacter luteus]|uniref:SDR family oxidoreductase n=1 Tax=Phaeodactylibacter luteus TaxID=1564516 RepID=A0A5C6RLY5_9BACT|nr:SDR family oxidoreductase [Phaeodactylibacter luteus]TXB62640.1 SDR family oxidoreductase [Phaeodactylibacter luteus]